MEYDVLIRNGTVIDHSQNLKGNFDIAISKGKIAAILSRDEDSNQTIRAHETIDVNGCLVTPGLIDIHTHVFQDHTYLGIKADLIGVEQGVTTVVDAGSSGAKTYAKFVEDVVENNTTEVLAWLNIAEQGLTEGRSELADLSRLAPAETVALLRRDPRVRGIKVRMSSSVVKDNGIRPLVIAKDAAREANVPVMVHIGNAPPQLAEVLGLLEKGDVVTHAFHGKPGGILDEQGQLIPSAQAALDRGVLFDVGHGSASFSFKTMEQSKKLGLAPFSISTDLYKTNYHGPVFSLTITMTKLLTLGYTIDQVIEATTWSPAKILRLEEEIGTLKVGTVADVSILKQVEKPITLVDSENNEIVSPQFIEPQYTIRAGKVLTCTWKRPE